MSQYELWSTIFGAVGAAVALVGVGVVWYQLQRHRTDRTGDSLRQRKEIEADHDRRMKQATIECLNQVRAEWRASTHEIRGALGRGPLSPENVKKLGTMPEVQETVYDLLSNLEVFSTGANVGVFDEKLIDRMLGGYLMALHDDFKALIVAEQREHQSSYVEFEGLVNRIRQNRLPGPIEKVKQITDGWPTK